MGFFYSIVSTLNKAGAMRSRSVFGFVLVVLATVIATGCATLPPTEVMKAETTNYRLPQLPQAGKAIVYVVRPSPLGGIIRFNVFLDDQDDESEMGYTQSGQYIYFTVAPGQHKIFSKAENWAEASFIANAGDIIFFQQEPTMGIIIARNNIFKLEDLNGKYLVKTLSLGTLLKTEK
ncbi:MAG: DUF2846 domain-containing protein [Pseudomonadota bacterium]